MASLFCCFVRPSGDVREDQLHDMGTRTGLPAGCPCRERLPELGYSQVHINGMEGKYTQILIDSRLVFSALLSIPV